MAEAALATSTGAIEQARSTAGVELARLEEARAALKRVEDLTGSGAFAEGEIIEQVLWAEELTGKRVSSLLYMGMGEPLANYDNVLSSLRTFRSPLAFNLGARRVTTLSAEAGTTAMSTSCTSRPPATRL